VESIELAALGRAVARWSSDILPSSSIAGSTDNITKLLDLLRWPAGATPAAVVVICERVAEATLKAPCQWCSNLVRPTLGKGPAAE
jgi:hypothetical protein